MSTHTTHRTVGASASAHTTRSFPILAPLAALLAITVSLTCALTSATPALAAAGEGCPNEQLRAESNVNPATGQPFSQDLPECRAYEMVTPLEKQQHDALNATPDPALVSPQGNTIAWSGQGDYAGAENYQAPGSHPANPYVAARTGAGWVTRSAYAPASLIEEPGAVHGALPGIFSPDLSGEASCGTRVLYSMAGTTFGCALRAPDGSWLGAPGYTSLAGAGITVELDGASQNLADEVFNDAPGAPLLPADTSTINCRVAECGGIYELEGIGGTAPTLRLVNVDDSGQMIGPDSEAGVGAGRTEPAPYGNDYQAISATGSPVYFTATPAGDVATIYARIEGRETVAISEPSPSQCTRTASDPGGECDAPQPALYEGASADGVKAFFMTGQQLVNADTDGREDLYEYDFAAPAGERIVQVSAGGPGDLTPGSHADVEGVLRVCEDGSHVYFVASGVLTSLPNGLGQTAVEGADNIYAYDTETGETKFVATVPGEDSGLWGGGETVSDSLVREKLAQTTPDGRYLVFDTHAKLIATGPEADTGGAPQVYRYDFQTGGLVRVSIAHDGFGDNGNTPGAGSLVAPLEDQASEDAASTLVNDFNRSISSNGEIIAFTTTEQLQADDTNGGTNALCRPVGRLTGLHEHEGCDVYVWHECAAGACTDGAHGQVSLVSDGVSAEGSLYAGMSASGSDVFFQTHTQLVGQDTDELGDIYDARVDGGFPAPAPEPSCAGEACQGGAAPAPVFAPVGSTSFTGGNLTPGSTAFPLPKASKPKPLTRAQELAAALKACERRDKRGKRRAACEKTAHKQYAPQAKKEGKTKK